MVSGGDERPRELSVTAADVEETPAAERREEREREIRLELQEESADLPREALRVGLRRGDDVGILGCRGRKAQAVAPAGGAPFAATCRM